MKVVVTGSSGLIGTALIASLRGDGHEVTRLVRRTPTGDDEAHWDPARHTIDGAAIDAADAVVNLAGAPIKRWNDAYRQTILRSRLDSTTTIARAIAGASAKPRVLVSASAVGVYGDRGDETLEETAPTGRGFLADVAQQWEDATAAASDAGVRVALIRTGLVLSGEGGLLGPLLPLFKLGLGGRLGSGRQWMPWIAITDEVAAIRFLLDHDECDGAYNLAAPSPVRNREFTKALGRAVHRPALAVVPALALKLALGEFAEEGPLVSQRVVPTRLVDAGFDFGFEDIDAALRALL